MEIVIRVFENIQQERDGIYRNELRENMLIKSNNGNWLITNKIQMNVCRLNEMKSEKNKYGIKIGIKK